MVRKENYFHNSNGTNLDEVTLKRFHRSQIQGAIITIDFPKQETQFYNSTAANDKQIW